MKELVFSCDNCRSKNISSARKIYNEKKEKRLSPSLDYEYWETVSYDVKYECKCNDCGHLFVEYGEK